jgi:Phosphopantetheine attachment site.
VWQKVLNHPEVGVKSDFFHLGGHSLLVQRLVHEINTEFGVMLGIRDVFENPTIEALVEIINDKKLIDTVVDENQMDSQETLEEMEW